MADNSPAFRMCLAAEKRIPSPLRGEREARRLGAKSVLEFSDNFSFNMNLDPAYCIVWAETYSASLK